MDVKKLHVQMHKGTTQAIVVTIRSSRSAGPLRKRSCCCAKCCAFAQVVFLRNCAKGATTLQKIQSVWHCTCVCYAFCCSFCGKNATIFPKTCSVLNNISRCTQPCFSPGGLHADPFGVHPGKRSGFFKKVVWVDTPGVAPGWLLG